MSGSTFLRAWLGFLIVLLVGLAGFNALIDPYGLFGTPRWVGFNQLKPAASSRVRIIKPYQVLRVHPNSLIAGNSRPEMGLDPNYSCWETNEHPVYSLTTPGSSVYMQVRQVQHALSARPVKTVLFGVDFLDFLVLKGTTPPQSRWPPPPQAFEQRLRVTATGTENPDYVWQAMQDHLQALFTLEAVVDSVKTVLMQGASGVQTRTELGFNPADEYYIDLIRHEGQAVLFRQKNNEVLSRLAGNAWSIFYRDSDESLSFEALRRLKEMAKRYQVELILFINPYHADYLEIIFQSGHWRWFEAWKRELATIAAAAPNPVPLFDFSGYDPFSMESPPQLGDTHRMLQWFWEPAHYRKELGNRMLARMLGESCPPSANRSAGLGVRLEPGNIDEHLAAIRKQRLAYWREVDDAASRIRQLIAGSRKPLGDIDRLP